MRLCCWAFIMLVHDQSFQYRTTVPRRQHKEEHCTKYLQSNLEHPVNMLGCGKQEGKMGKEKIPGQATQLSPLPQQNRHNQKKIFYIDEVTIIHICLNRQLCTTTILKNPSNSLLHSKERKSQENSSLHNALLSVIQEGFHLKLFTALSHACFLVRNLNNLTGHKRTLCLK